MKTTDRIMHQARNERGRLECVWKRDPLFQSASEDGAAAPHPAERTPARPRLVTPKPPSGGFSPPVPQGSGGRFPDMEQTSLTHSTPTPNEIMLK